MKKDLPTLLLEAERAFDEKFTVTWEPPQVGNFPDTRGLVKRFTEANAVKSFLRETLLSILSEAEEAVSLPDIDLDRQVEGKVVLGIEMTDFVGRTYKAYRSDLIRRWRKWRGNLK